MEKKAKKQQREDDDPDSRALAPADPSTALEVLVDLDNARYAQTLEDKDKPESPFQAREVREADQRRLADEREDKARARRAERLAGQ